MKHIVFIILIIFSFVSCSVKYSLSGASISPDIKTFTVEYITNQAPQKQPTLSDIFTEGLKAKFRNNAGLTMVSSNGDLQFDGAIIDYNTKHQGVTATQVAAQMRLTISISVNFVNVKEPSKNFKEKFSAYRDYDAQQSLNSVEDALIQEISKEIIDQIFMKAVANW